MKEPRGTTRRRFRGVPLLTAMLLAVSLVLSLGVARITTAAATTPVPNQKTACAYTRDLDGLQQFSTMVGTPMSCSMVFNDTATNWTDWDTPWFLHAPASQPQNQWPAWLAAGNGTRTLVVTQSMVPTGIESNWRTLGASGAYDSYIRTLAVNLIAAGAGSAIIRLGHEANGDWYFDNIGSSQADYTAWAKYWAHFDAVLKSVPGAHFELDWTVNAGYRAVPFPSYYPGDWAVDIIGIDYYDGAAVGTGTAEPLRWNTTYYQQYGLRDLVAFAAQRGKPLSIPEWGVIDSSLDATGGGDDSYFVDQLALVVRSNNVRYQSYFNVVAGGNAQLQTMPASRAAWIRHYGPNGDALVGSTAPAPTPSPTVSPTGPAHAPGDNKTVCVDPSSSLAALQRFSTLVGRAVNCAALSNAAPADWAAWESPWQIRMPAATYPDYQWPQWVADGHGARTIVLSQALVPAGMPTDWRAQGAAGAYDSHATALATNLVAAGLGSSIIRLSPKGNGDWQADSIGTTAADMANWKAYWARVVRVMRAVPGAHFTFDWSVNGNYRAIAFDSYYPGDDVVDSIGISQYDWAATTVGLVQPARFANQLGWTDGLAALVAYAQTHGKPLSISEWGLVDTAKAGGGGDDPYFVDQLGQIVKQNTTSFQVEEETTAGQGLPLANAPSALAMWKQHFGTGGDAAGS